MKTSTKYWIGGGLLLGYLLLRKKPEEATSSPPASSSETPRSLEPSPEEQHGGRSTILETRELTPDPPLAETPSVSITVEPVPERRRRRANGALPTREREETPEERAEIERREEEVRRAKKH